MYIHAVNSVVNRVVKITLILVFLFLISQELYPATPGITARTDSPSASQPTAHLFLTVTEGFPKGILLFVIGVMITIGFLVILFMLNHVVSNPQLEAWIKVEFWQLIATVFIGTLVLLLFRGADVLAGILNPSETGTTWGQLVINKVGQQYSSTAAIYVTTSQTYFVFSRYVTFSYSRTTSIPGAEILITSFESGAPASGLSPLYGQLSHAFDRLSQSLMVIASEIVLLKFIFFAVPLYLLPLGLVFRAFPFTRMFGSTLIAIAFSLYFLFPLTLYIFYELYGSIIHMPGAYRLQDARQEIESITNSVDIGNVPYGRAIANPIASGIAAMGDFGFKVMVCGPTCAALWALGAAAWGACWEACSIMAEFVYIWAVPGFQYLYGHALANYAVVSYADMSKMFMLVVDKVAPLVSFIWLMTIIGFISALTVTISSVRGLAAALGGELQLYGLSRML